MGLEAVGVGGGARDRSWRGGGGWCGVAQNSAKPILFRIRYSVGDPREAHNLLRQGGVFCDDLRKVTKRACLTKLPGQASRFSV